jgi:hypothetical protein
VKHRTWNHQVIAIGRKGCGKSEWSVGQVLDWAKQPAYAFAHDPGFKIPEVLHDGRLTYKREFHSAHEAREAFFKNPRGLFCISTDNCTEVHELAQEVAQLSLEKHGGTEGTPSVFYIDEIAVAEICDPNYLEPSFKMLMVEARHRHVAIIAGIQSARLLNNQLLTLATQIQLFQITDKRDHRRLIECGLDEELVAQAGKLPPHKSITVTL